MKLLTLKIALCSLFLTSQAVMAEDIEIETFRGPASVASSPETIAVFDIPAVDTLNALEVPIKGTVSKLFVDYLDDVAKSAETVGSIFEPDYKALAVMKPDLIIVGGRSYKTLDKVSKISPAIDMTVYGPNLMELTRNRVRDFGKIFNKTEKAEELLNSLDTAVKDAQAAAANKGDGLIIMANGAKLSAFGTESRFGWIHSTLKLKAATDDVNVANHGDSISFEFILDLNPDWLLVIDRGAAIGEENQSASQTLDNELIHKTNAWKNERIVYLNSTDIYVASGGIQSQLRTLKHLTKAFNKEKITANR